MIEGAIPPAWCGRCGASATVDQVSLDLTRPLVLCGRRGSGGTGCGRVIGTTRYAEAHGASVRWRRRFASNLHKRHTRYEWTDLYCDGCAAAGWVTRGPEFGTLTPARSAGA